MQICKYSQLSNLQRSKQKILKIAVNGICCFCLFCLNTSLTKEWNVSIWTLVSYLIGLAFKTCHWTCLSINVVDYTGNWNTCWFQINKDVFMRKITLEIAGLTSWVFHNKLCSYTESLLLSYVFVYVYRGTSCCSFDWDERSISLKFLSIKGEYAYSFRVELRVYVDWKHSSDLACPLHSKKDFKRWSFWSDKVAQPSTSSSDFFFTEGWKIWVKIAKRLTAVKAKQISRWESISLLNCSFKLLTMFRNGPKCSYTYKSEEHQWGLPMFLAIPQS